MKKLFTTLALVAGLSIGAFAQNCYTGPNTTITPHTGTTPGLSPNSDSLPCAIRGQQVHDTIYFTNFLSFGGQTVNNLTIDSIGNLPAGTCWVSNKADNKFAGGENGIIYVTGTVHALPGQYKLKIFVSANLGAGLNVGPLDAESAAQLRYYVRVSCSGSACPSIDTINGKTQSFIPYSSQVCPQVGINDVNTDLSNISVVPNPFASAAKVSFTSEVEGAFTVKMVSLLGAVVSSKEVNVSRGGNEITIERNNLSAGIYILSLSNANGTVTRKVVID